MLAVLPFENLGPETDREYLADGLTEEVIAALGQIDPVRLSVIGGRRSCDTTHDRSRSRRLARELGAAFLVESSLRSEGGRIRVTSNLVRANDQVQIWSATYDSEPKSMLAFQRELSTTIAQQIRLRLSPERLDALARRQAHNPEAYDAYLQGRYYWNLFTPATTRKAVECYLRATQLDPNYALAWSGLADAYTSSPIHADARPRDVWEKARRAAEQAIAVEPELAETQTSWGFVKFWLDWDWTEAEAAYRKGDCNRSQLLAGIPAAGDSARPYWTSRRRSPAGDGAGACASIHCKRCIMRCRHRWHFWHEITWRHSNLRGSPQLCCRTSGLQICRWRKRTSNWASTNMALEALSRGGGVGGENSKVISLRGYVLAKMGRENEAREVLKTLEALGRERYIPPYAIAQVLYGTARKRLGVRVAGTRH